MAFSAANLNCIGVGPSKLYIYKTDDTLTSPLITAQFDTTNCPGMAVGDIIYIVHTDSTGFAGPIRITAIDATSCQYATPTQVAHA